MIDAPRESRYREGMRKKYTIIATIIILAIAFAGGITWYTKTKEAPVSPDGTSTTGTSRIIDTQAGLQDARLEMGPDIDFFQAPPKKSMVVAVLKQRRPDYEIYSVQAIDMEKNTREDVARIKTADAYPDQIEFADGNIIFVDPNNNIVFLDVLTGKEKARVSVQQTGISEEVALSTEGYISNFLVSDSKVFLIWEEFMKNILIAEYDLKAEQGRIIIEDPPLRPEISKLLTYDPNTKVLRAASIKSVIPGSSATIYDIDTISGLAKEVNRVSIDYYEAEKVCLPYNTRDCEYEQEKNSVYNQIIREQQEFMCHGTTIKTVKSNVIFKINKEWQDLSQKEEIYLYCQE